MNLFPLYGANINSCQQGGWKPSPLIARSEAHKRRLMFINGVNSWKFPQKIQRCEDDQGSSPTKHCRPQVVGRAVGDLLDGFDRATRRVLHLFTDGTIRVIVGEIVGNIIRWNIVVQPPTSVERVQEDLPACLTRRVCHAGVGDGITVGIAGTHAQVPPDDARRAKGTVRLRSSSEPGEEGEGAHNRSNASHPVLCTLRSRRP